MTKDEALRLALEALEDLARYEHPQTMIQIRKKDGGSIVTMYPHKVASDAITAIKAALEAKDEPVVWNEGVPAMLPKQKEGETFIVSYEPKLEAKDEPVACGACNGSGHMVRDPDIGTDQECFVCEGSGVFEDTTPPQRKPLTNQQIAKILEHGDVAESNDKVGWYVLPYSFARAIEAAHGIKGEA